MFPKQYNSLRRVKGSPKAKRIKLDDDKGTPSSLKSDIFSDKEPSSQTSKNRNKRLLESLKTISSRKSSVLDYTPNDLTSESSSDDDLELATIPPSVSRPSTEETKPSLSKPSKSHLESPKPKPDDNETDFIQRIKNIRESATPKPKIDVVGDILNDKVDPDVVQTKFKHLKIPQVTSNKSNLYKRSKRYLELVPKFLNGSEKMSFFYDLAQLQRNSGAYDTLRQEDKYQINWDDFVGGYYGIKRQFYISNIILNKYNKEITKAAKRNSTIAYWGTDDFTKYVLANEIIIRMAMEDLNISLDEARDIIKKTSEYGSVITDSQELHDAIEPPVQNNNKPLKIDDLFN